MISFAVFRQCLPRCKPILHRAYISRDVCDIFFPFFFCFAQIWSFGLWLTVSDLWWRITLINKMNKQWNGFNVSVGSGHMLYVVPAYHLKRFSDLTDPCPHDLGPFDDISHRGSKCSIRDVPIQVRSLWGLRRRLRHTFLHRFGQVGLYPCVVIVFIFEF